MSPVISSNGALEMIAAEIKDDFMLARLKHERPALWRELVKKAKQARGLTPITTDKGDAKRALTLIVGSSGRQRRKARKAIQRAMRLHSSD